MAYYKKTVKQTGDIRARNYAVYHCDECNKDSDFTLTPNFQFIERICPHCKAMGAGDRLNTLKADRERLVKQMADLNANLLKIDTEIEELESKTSVTQQIEEITADNKQEVKA